MFTFQYIYDFDNERTRTPSNHYTPFTTAVPVEQVKPRVLQNPNHLIEQCKMSKKHTFSCSKDMSLLSKSNDKSVSWGKSEYLTVGMSASGQHEKVSIVQWDCSSINSNSIVKKAVFEIHTAESISQPPSECEHAINVHEIIQPWTYETKGSDKLIIAETPSVTFSVSFENSIYSCDITALVAKWISSPQLNNGICLKYASKNAECSKQFYSSRSGMGPRLHVAL